MEKDERVKINFLGFKYETENPTVKGITILIIILLFLGLLVMLCRT
jgi:hypothetical protein